MSNVTRESKTHEQTSVDDVRRIREQLSAEFGNDVQALAEHARQVTEQCREQLGLVRQESNPTQDFGK